MNTAPLRVLGKHVQIPLLFAVFGTMFETDPVLICMVFFVLNYHMKHVLINEYTSELHNRYL